MKRVRVCVLAGMLVLPLLACQPGATAHPTKERPVPDMPDIQAQLAFTCAYEKDKIPPRDPEADQLYKHARWLAKNNILKNDPALYPPIERLIRVATAHGHDKANLELRQMIGKGQADSGDPPEADQLYKHARWLARNNILKNDPTVCPSIERLVRIATARGYDKANLELRQMIGKGQADSDDSVKETLDLTEDLIQRVIGG